MSMAAVGAVGSQSCRPRLPSARASRGGVGGVSSRTLPSIPSRVWERRGGEGRGERARVRAAAGEGKEGSLRGDLPTSSSPAPPAPAGDLGSFLKAFYKFVRPHTVRGTILGSTAVTLKVLMRHPGLIDLSLVPRALWGVAALLCANAFIVGINQIYDVEVDLINKPFLPIAAGEMSKQTAWVLVVALGVAGTLLAWNMFGSLIGALYTSSLVIGTLYSIPQTRWKTKPLLALASIVFCRGVMLNFGVHYATKSALGLEPGVPGLAGLARGAEGGIGFISAMVFAYTVVIAVTKDLADVRGDRALRVTTFATKLGIQKVSQAASILLFAAYAAAAALGLAYPNAFHKYPMVIGHAGMALYLLMTTLGLSGDNFSQDAIKQFYRRIWNLFYAQYVLYLLI